MSMYQTRCFIPHAVASTLKGEKLSLAHRSKLFYVLCVYRILRRKAAVVKKFASRTQTAAEEIWLCVAGRKSGNNVPSFFTGCFWGLPVRWVHFEILTVAGRRKL